MHTRILVVKHLEKREEGGRILWRWIVRFGSGWNLFRIVSNGGVDPSVSLES
jgi:hypothetical protein